MSEGINIPASQLRQWEADKARLEQEILAKQQELAAIVQRLDAVKVLSSKHANTLNGTILPLAGIGAANATNMTDAIERIVVNSPAPITKKDLKKRLYEMGFPAKQLEAYVYTPIMRLKNARRVSVLSDGRLWKPDQ